MAAHKLALQKAQELFQQKRWQDARVVLLEILDGVQDPETRGEALEGMGYIAAKEGNYSQASEYLEHACRLLPASAERDHYAGYVHQCAARHSEAVACLTRCVEADPANLDACHLLASSLIASKDFEGALRVMSKAESTGSRRSASLHFTRALALSGLGQYDAEIQEYRKAIALNPGFINAYVNLGVVLRSRFQFDDALACFKKALAIDPAHAGARTNRAQTNLLLGNFQHGWKDYEWRWRDGGQASSFSSAPWLGNGPIRGKTVLVHNEQGLGDTLQFLRYIEPLAALGPSRIILRVQDSLRSLLQGYPQVAQIIGEHEQCPAFDVHCPLMSLPLALQKTHPAIPVKQAYLLPPSEKTADWADRFSAGTLRLGIVWQGNPGHPDDSNRSIPLGFWEVLFNESVEFVSLQKDISDDDRLSLRRYPWIRDVSTQIRDFSDTAGLVANLDLVITVDTSVAHLAGAMGKQVWVLLPHMPDWRWQLTRTDSPWYPSARLFRQPSAGAWKPVFESVRLALVDAIKASQNGPGTVS